MIIILIFKYKNNISICSIISNVCVCVCVRAQCGRQMCNNEVEYFQYIMPPRYSWRSVLKRLFFSEWTPPPSTTSPRSLFAYRHSCCSPPIKPKKKTAPQTKTDVLWLSEETLWIFYDPPPWPSFLRPQHIPFLQWPHFPADTSPMKLLWDVLDLRVHQHVPVLGDIHELISKSSALDRMTGAGLLCCNSSLIVDLHKVSIDLKCFYFCSV